MIELESATAKITKSGKSMIVVSAKKEYSNEKGLALTERRQWLFREAVSNAEVITDRTQASTQQDTLLVPGKKLGTMTASEVLLFRFSALTFNSHHIHYNKDALAKEGHPDLVVHGPLNVLLLANAYREQSRHALSSMTYRAQSPVYVHQPYSLYLDGQKVQAVSDATNKVIMSADVLCDSGKHGTVSTSS
jgi:hydroxyacyl-ACP dehydratase HTD2-like protein with hotdog domain